MRAVGCGLWAVGCGWLGFRKPTSAPTVSHSHYQPLSATVSHSQRITHSLTHSLTQYLVHCVATSFLLSFGLDVRSLVRLLEAADVHFTCLLVVD